MCACACVLIEEFRVQGSGFGLILKFKIAGRWLVSMDEWDIGILVRGLLFKSVPSFTTSSKVRVAGFGFSGPSFRTP